MSAVIVNPPLTPSVFEPPAPKPAHSRHRGNGWSAFARRPSLPGLEPKPLSPEREQQLVDAVQGMTEAELNLRLINRHVMDKRIFVLAELIEEEAYVCGHMPGETEMAP